MSNIVHMNGMFGNVTSFVDGKVEPSHVYQKAVLRWKLCAKFVKLGILFDVLEMDAWNLL